MQTSTFAKLLLIAASLVPHVVPAAEPPGSPWWTREPMRIFELVTAFGQIDSIPAAQMAERMAALGLNATHLHVMNHNRGLDESGFFFKTRLASKQNSDFLGEFLPEAHKRGIKVFIYTNVHFYTTEFGVKHPDWRQIQDDGEPVTGVYGTSIDFCINSPWREWVFQLLRDLSAYPIDGIFYDGPIFRANTCYCRHCQAKFRKLHGRDLPSKRDRRGRDFEELLAFQSGSMAEFLRDSQSVVKSIRPDIALYMNGGVLGGNWATARLNRVIGPEQDLLITEGGFIYNDLTRVPLWKPGVTARLLESQAGGKPFLIASAMAHKPWTYSILPAPELRLLYADSIANGAGVWFALTTYEFNQPEAQVVGEMNRFLQRNNRYFQGSRSEARTALVWSDDSANFYAGSDAQMIDISVIKSRSEVGNLDREFWGLAESLLRAHIPFDVIDDWTLEREPLNRYDAIYLPNVACMSARVAARLGEYVRGGGHLFATFETSLYDEMGMPRADFALADLFGVSLAGKIAGPRRFDFMQPASRDGVLLRDLPRELIPSPTYYVRVKANGAGRVLLFTKPLEGPYDRTPEISDDPAITFQRIGKGSVVYSSGDLGAAISAFRLPELLQLVENAALDFGSPPVLLENAPGSVEVVLRSQEEGRRLILHLINFTGEMTRPIRKILPQTDIRITLPATRRISKAQTLMRPRNLVVKRDAQGRPQLTLPRLDEYEVIVLEP